MSRFARNLGYAKKDVLELWREIADALDFSAGLIRPQDRFGTEVGGGFILTPELDTLSELAAERAEWQGLTIDLQTIGTVDAYVRAFARQQAQI